MIRRYFSKNVKILTNNKQLPSTPILPKHNKNQDSISQFFVDYKVTTIKGGKGGDGLVSFMHLKANEFAGPDGGDGGNGGHVIFKADSNLKSLNKIKSIYQAENGVDGKPFHMRGKNGDHLIINVPVGTTFKNMNLELVKELTSKNEKFIASRGGRGGHGNHYYLSNENREPLEFEIGNCGEDVTLNVELKLIADAALIGYPNVGKSSLLNSLTRARSKVGDYSFTTRHPHVGIVEYKDFQQISIADLPGLLPDLSRGFGTRFLQHLEKCKMIILVMDMSLNNPIEQYENMKAALNSFDKIILKSKPVLIVANKIDQINAQENLNLFRSQIKQLVIPVSAKKKINLTKFLSILRDLYDEISLK